MLFETHKNCKIGYKKLSESELGLSAGHETHIGLFFETLNFLPKKKQILGATLIYEERSFDLICFLGFINNKRSPKIRKGQNKEVESERKNSVVRQILDITGSNRDIHDWYLMWFVLKDNSIVFFLFNNQSADYDFVSKTVPDISKDGIIGNKAPEFSQIKSYLERKSEGYLRELEIIAQTEEIVQDATKAKLYDVEKARKLFEETGKDGEKLIARYLKKLKSDGKIKDYIWVNELKESGMPYDFEVTELDGKTFIDVKTTSYNFEQDIFISYGELKWINKNADYHIYRVFDLNEKKPALRTCKDIKVLSKKLVPHIEVMEKGLLADGGALGGVKIRVSPGNKDLTFGAPIKLF